MVECELARIIIDERRDEQVIFLREVGGERLFPIIIGIFEATVIDRILKERPSERPLTHDLLVNVARELGGKIVAVEITELKADVFFATLVVRQGEREARIDARPSDAVALALREKAPIYVAEKILDKVGRPEGRGPGEK